VTPCNPSSPVKACALCERYSPTLPHLAECRRVVCIDASTVLRNGQCQLVAWRPTKGNP
jgi:hypothetical protein